MHAASLLKTKALCHGQNLFLRYTDCIQHVIMPVTAGMLLVARTGSHTGSYCGLYVPDPRGKTHTNLVNRCMNHAGVQGKGQ